MGLTALHFTTPEGHVEAVKTLVQLSADIEAKTARGATLLRPRKPQVSRGQGAGRAGAVGDTTS